MTYNKMNEWRRQTPCLATRRDQNTAFTLEARIEAGTLLRLLQGGASIGLPHSRPMPSIGRRCHELRIPDEDVTWRIIYRTDSDAIVIAEVFAKKTGKAPK